MIMLSFHPIIQLIATLLTIYVLVLGTARFRQLHLKQEIFFKWQRHVKLGTASLLMLLFGALFGSLMVKVFWHGFFITGSHGRRLFFILPLIFTGLFSGWYMHKWKKKRVVLPLMHGSINVLLIGLLLFHALSGRQVYNAYVLGN
ncbi:MAG TPA: DUF4079 domain-containing protein [Desulfobacterales bacterium]|nr:DUF4079 domain-containing protein [Desulfobacterales bacterium]